MKRMDGFTFVETLVVMLMIGLLVGGSMIYLSKSLGKRAVEEVSGKVIDQLELARSNAKVRRLAEGQTLSSFQYVAVTLDDGGILTIASNNDDVYSQVSVASPEVSVSTVTDGQLYFSAGEAKLLNADASGPLPVDSTVEILVSLKKDGTVYKNIIINSSGIIKKE